MTLCCGFGLALSIIPVAFCYSVSRLVFRSAILCNDDLSAFGSSMVCWFTVNAILE